MNEKLNKGLNGKLNEGLNEQGKRMFPASLTAEAALVMPAILTLLLFFLYIIQILYVEQDLYIAAAKALRDASSYGYIFKYADGGMEALREKKGEYYEAVELAGEMLWGVGNELWFGSAIKNRLMNEKSVDKAVKGGFSKISFLGSNVYAEDEISIVRMEYKIAFPLFSMLIPPISFQKNIIMRSFSGDGSISFESGKEGTEEEGEEGYVYVTETGTVYHIISNCTYIKLSLAQKNLKDIPELRNRYGGKYYPCDACVKAGEKTEKVWVTETGTHYHSQKNCGKIKRNVRKISISEAKDYRPCSRCAANKKVEDHND